MKRNKLFEQINHAYRGSDDDVPSNGTADYELWENTTNRKISEWARDPKNKWNSLFSRTAPNELGTVATAGTTTLTGTDTYFTDYQVGDKIIVSGETERIIDTITSDTVLDVTEAFTNTVTANKYTHISVIKSGVQTYNLHRQFYQPSDSAIASGTQDYEYSFSLPQERDRFVLNTYISGIYPKNITFTDTIDSDNPIVGSELEVPGYFLPEDLTADTDTVPVDDPYWLVYTVASELAFNDLTYADKYAELNNKANNLYSMMIKANRNATNKYPRTIRTSVNRIIGTENE
jgi:hypothetical protein